MNANRPLDHVPARPDRRRVLTGGLAGAVGLALAPRAWARGGAQAAAGGDPGGNLVVLQFTGGSDGLSLLVPWADDRYHALRPTIRISPSEVLRLDELRGLHPGLERLRARWDTGTVALFEGVGYPHPIRSHFKSMDVWQAGDRAGRAAGEGWIGRLAPEIPGRDRSPLAIVHVGERLPFSLYSRSRPPVAFTAPEVYRWVADGAVLARLDGGKEDADRPGATGRERALAHIRETATEAAASSEAVRDAVARHRPSVRYPDDDLGRDLRIAAALLHGGVGTRVISVELGGFDHHNDLSRRYDRLMRTLDPALDAFLTDLGSSEAGRRTAVLCFSEFGRRVAENGSRGTDHGKAGPVLVLGAPVRGGFYGQSPSLEDLDQGDLAYSTDFRTIYAATIRQLFGVDPTRVLGGDFTPPPLLHV